MITLIIIGRHLAVVAKEKSAEVLQSLIDLQPHFATLMPHGLHNSSSNNNNNNNNNNNKNHDEDFVDVDTDTAAEVNPHAEQVIDVRLLEHGDIVKVMPGARIPTDGVIVRGETTVDESRITGETALVRKAASEHKQHDYHSSFSAAAAAATTATTATTTTTTTAAAATAATTTKSNPQAPSTTSSLSSRVLGGSLNKGGVIFIKVTHIVSENSLSKITHLVQQAQLSKLPVQVVADRATSYMVPFIFLLAMAVFGFWYGMAQSKHVNTEGSTPNGTFAMLFALSVLVVACPCAFTLAAPMAITVGTSVAAKFGILFTRGNVVEHMRWIDTVVFNKSSTLMQGKPVVTTFKVFDHDLSDAAFWSLLASAEHNSAHVLAHAMVQHAHTVQGAKLLPSANVQAYLGKGLSCTVDGHSVLVGNRDLIAESNVQMYSAAEDKAINADNGVLAQLERQGNTVVCVAVDNRLAGLVALKDHVKPEARAAIRELQKRDIDVWLLSGDNRRATQRIASEAGVEVQHMAGRLSPKDKADCIRRLQHEEERVVCVVGDAARDVPALVQADFSIGLGAGSDVGLALTDIVLVKSDLRDVVHALDLARNIFRRIQFNFFWTCMYNLLVVPLAIGVFYTLEGANVPPQLAGLSEFLSLLPVVLSSLLLRSYVPRRYA